MKKYLVIFGAALLVMALAAPAMAQFSSWGHMEIQTIWEQKPNFDTASLWANGSVTAANTKDLNWRHVAERFRYYLAYGDPKTVRAVIGFEADSKDWGENQATSFYGGGGIGRYTADTVALEVKHAYLDFMIPNTPVEVIAGIQPWAYGGRLLINNDGAGVTVKANFAPHTISAGWLRFSDANRYSYGVTDGYILDWKMVQKAFDVNVYGVFVNDRFEGQQTSFVEPWAASTIGVTNPFDQKLYYLGASAGFRPGNWTFFVHGLYVMGTRSFDNSAIDDTDIKAWAAEAMARYQIGPGMAALVELFYATGQDSDDTGTQNYFPVARASEARSIFGNDRTVFFWMNAAQMGYYHNQQIDFSGVYYARAAFEYSPTPWMRMIFNYLYLGDSSEGTPGTFTPKFSGTPTTKIVNSPKGARQDVDEDYIGQEINLITTFNIYKNFVYNIGLYYFVAGDVFDSATQNAKDSYGINTKLQYAF